MKLLPAPIYAFFSKDFYRLIVQEKTSKGFQYLAYLAGLAVFVLWIAFFGQISPMMNQTADWLRDEMPSMTWTPDGLVLNAHNPYEMVHPKFGKVAVFDMTRQDVSAQDFDEAFIFVTRKSFFLKDVNGADVKAYDISMDPNTRDASSAEFIQTINGETAYEFVHRSKSTIFWVGSLLFFPLYFVWKLFQVLILSGIGYLINMTLKEPLPYEKVFLLGCFIVTPISLIELRGFIFAPLFNIPFGWIGAFFVAAVYYYFILKACEADLIQAQGLSEE